MRKIYFILTALFLIQQSFAQTVDRTKPPKAGPAPVIKIGDPVTYKLKNGITVLVVENHKFPKVNASYFIDAGPVTEGIKAGMLDIMGQMLNEGTKIRSKAEFDEAVDRMGANVGLSSSGGNASSLTRYFDSAFALMTEALKEPALTEASFKKIQTQTITGLKTEEKSAKAIGSRVTNALLYGLNHPSGEFVTEESVNNLSLNDIQQAYKKYITPARGYLTFVGDIKPQEAKVLAEKYLGNWQGYPLTLEKLPVAKNPTKTEIDLIDVPNAVQSEIRVTNLVTLPLGSTDYFPVLIANQILGGGAQARLFMNLREKHGFTYGAYSNVGSGRFQAAFSSYASVRNAKTDSAVAEFLNELKRIRTDKVSTDELQQAKALYNGSFALGLENPGLVATFARNILINGLPKDFYRTYLQHINAVTAEDVQRVAQKYFSYADTRIVIAGKASEIVDGLKKLDYPIKMYDKYAKPVSDSPKVAVNKDAKTIINDYLTAIGGQDALMKVKSIHTSLTMEMQGMTLNVEDKKLAPNLSLTTVSMGGNVVSKELYNGTMGYREQMGNKTDLSDKDMKDLKATTSLFPQIDYVTNPDIKLNVTGTEKVNGKDAYKVEITLPSGKQKTEYYDLDSKLLVRDEEQIEQNGMTILKTEDYGDYKKTGDVMLPYKLSMTVSAGGQEQSFEMNAQDIKMNEGITAEDFK
ncbi:MAG: insulinase family protein [Ilyomonas sp.]